MLENPQQVAPGVFRLKVPVPSEALNHVNSYLVQSEGRNMLIDTGWNTDVAYDFLVDQLKGLGVALSDLHVIVFTHFHPDHYGLAGRFAEHTSAELVLHEVECTAVQSRYMEIETVLGEMDHWLRVHGAPDHDRPDVGRSAMAMKNMVSAAVPDRSVRAGDHIDLGTFDFEVLWTPGHSPGHICLFDRKSGLFFAGDHVLPGISPNVSLHFEAMGNPLGDYQDALRAVESLPAKLVLPGHGDPFLDLSGRAREILAHHQERNREILAALNGERRTAYQVAQIIPWNTKGVAWDDLALWTRRSAVTETLAHLKAMQVEGLVTSAIEEGCFWYGVA